MMILKNTNYFIILETLYIFTLFKNKKNNMDKDKLYNDIMNVCSTTIKNVLNEKSINAKKRDIQNAIDTYTKGKAGYNNIKTFGIVTAENPDSIEISRTDNKKRMKTLSNSLKSAHYVFVKQKGRFGGNNEYSYFIFNISLDTLIYYAGLYQQRSFFYCELKNNKVISHYYEKEDTTLPYDKKNNPYVLIESSDEYIDASDADEYSELGEKFKYTIPLKYFESINNKISDNLKRLDERYNPNTIIQQSIECVGQWSWYLRQKLYNGIL